MVLGHAGAQGSVRALGGIEGAAGRAVAGEYGTAVVGHLPDPEVPVWRLLSAVAQALGVSRGRDDEPRGVGHRRGNFIFMFLADAEVHDGAGGGSEGENNGAEFLSGQAPPALRGLVRLLGELGEHGILGHLDEPDISTT